MNTILGILWNTVKIKWICVFCFCFFQLLSDVVLPSVRLPFVIYAVHWRFLFSLFRYSHVDVCSPNVRQDGHFSGDTVQEVWKTFQRSSLLQCEIIGIICAFYFPQLLSSYNASNYLIIFKCSIMCCWAEHYTTVVGRSIRLLYFSFSEVLKLNIKKQKLIFSNMEPQKTSHCLCHVCPLCSLSVWLRKGGIKKKVNSISLPPPWMFAQCFRTKTGKPIVWNSSEVGLTHFLLFIHLSTACLCPGSCSCPLTFTGMVSFSVRAVSLSRNISARHSSFVWQVSLFFSFFQLLYWFQLLNAPFR